MKPWWRAILWGGGILLVIMGALDWNPSDLTGGLLTSWGGGGADRAIVAGAVLLIAAFALTVLDRLKPPTG